MKRIYWITFLAIIILSTNAFANGLSLNNIGPRALGMAGAQIGWVDDYTAIYWNPAGLVNVRGTQIAVFATDIIPIGTYKLNYTLPPQLGGKEFNIDATTVTNHYISPNLMAYMPIMEGDLTIGIGAYVPAGLGAEWDGNDLVDFNMPNTGPYDWMGKIAAINFSPAIAYRINEMFSVGAALNVYYGMFEMQRPMDMYNMMTQQGGEDGLMDTQYKEDGSGLGFGAAFGLMVKPHDLFSLGLSFKTETNVAFKGDASLLGVVTQNQELKTDYERDLAWPMWFGGGIAFFPTECLTVAADINWSNWAKTQEMIVTDYLDFPEAIKEGAKEMHLEWEDCIQYRVGLQYAIPDEMWAVRLGYYYDPAPSPDKTLNIVFPSITYNAVTFGGSLMFGKLGIDIGAEYMIGTEREITFGEYAEAMPGLHNMNIFAVSLGLSYYLGE
jgi:long-chain fatty acid transport protein